MTSLKSDGLSQQALRQHHDFIDVRFSNPRLRALRSGATPLALFFVGTLVLAGWLGYQAVDAAVSQRRVAEAVLSDYARISATEMARIIDWNMDDVLDDVFDQVTDDDRGGRRESPSTADVRRELASAMREEECPCPGLREPVAVFSILPETGEVEVLPDTLPAGVVDLIVDRVRTKGMVNDESRGLFTLVPAETGAHPIAVGYALPEDPFDPSARTFGFVTTWEGLGELFQEWYEDESLLPEPIAGDLPNDSLLGVSVQEPDGDTIFVSAVGFSGNLSATAPVDAEYGDLIVTAAVRPEAASRLVIGGLPRSRLPLLTLLLLLTMGVGIAAAVQLRREQEFQRLREDFVSGVSHELRTPLAQIRMFAELQSAGKLPSAEDRKRATAIIHRESVRLSHLVENILQFSRLRRLPEQLPKERVNLADATREGIDAVTPLIEDQGMRLEVAAGAENLPVMANREAVTRIVVNLLDNAVKYGPTGQTVSVSMERVNGSARLSVSDQGPGIPDRERPLVWKAYHRLERDVRANIPGTGIGLSVVADLASLHGGRAWVEDAVPSGARFVVELPVLPDESALASNGDRA